MICVIHGVLLKRLLYKLSCVQFAAGCKSYGVLRSVLYSQPLIRYFKTNTIVQLPEVSETCAEQAAEKFPTNSEHDLTKLTTMEEQMQIVFSKYPGLAQAPAGHLKSFLCNLSELGFSVDDSVEMVNKCMDILRMSKSQLLQVVLAFRQCKLSDEDIIFVLRSSPEHLLVDRNAIVARYKSLRLHFPHKFLKHVFSNSPGIALMKWEVLQKKLEYLINVMHVLPREIALSKALCRSLEEIRARHLFLERAGLFKATDPKSNIPSENHKLTQITDTEDEYFAVNVAGLTAEEYFVFQELLLLEGEAGGLNDDDAESIK